MTTTTIATAATAAVTTAPILVIARGKYKRVVGAATRIVECIPQATALRRAGRREPPEGWQRRRFETYSLDQGGLIAVPLDPR